MDTEAAGIPSIRTFDLIVPVSGYLEGTLDDWPAVIQDGVYAALERKAHEVEGSDCWDACCFCVHEGFPLG